MTANIVSYQPPSAPVAQAGASVLLPANLTEGMRFADMMAGSRLVPVHLQKSPADCMMVLMQAMRWRMDPFAVAQATSVIQGKLMYEGKLVAAVVNSLGQLTKRLSYAYSGEGDNRTVVVSGTLQGDPEPLTVSVRLKDAKTNNKVWQTQPDQQLAYHAARVWARRYMPELMLGVYAPEEFDAAPMRDITPVSESPRPAVIPPEKSQQPAKPPLQISLPHGWPPAEFARTKKGLREALEFLTGAVVDGAPAVVGMNVALLDQIAEKMPELAGEVAELRSAAAEALAPDDDGVEPSGVGGALDPEEVDEFGLPPVRSDRLPEDPPA